MRAWSSNEIIFESSLISIIDKGNARINFVIPDLLESRDTRLPICRIIAEKVIHCPRQLVNGFQPRIGVGSDQIHLQIGSIDNAPLGIPQMASSMIRSSFSRGG